MTQHACSQTPHVHAPYRPQPATFAWSTSSSSPSFGLAGPRHHQGASSSSRPASDVCPGLLDPELLLRARRLDRRAPPPRRRGRGRPLRARLRTNKGPRGGGVLRRLDIRGARTAPPPSPCWPRISLSGGWGGKHGWRPSLAATRRLCCDVLVRSERGRDGRQAGGDLAHRFDGACVEEGGGQRGGLCLRGGGRVRRDAT